MSSLKSCTVALLAAVSFAVGLQAQQAAAPAAAQSAASASANRPCHIAGRVTSGDAPLPGATVTAMSGDRTVAVTSTDLDGTYGVPLVPSTVKLKIELMAFVPVEREVTVGQPPCDVETNIALTLVSRAPAAMLAAAPPPTRAPAPAVVSAPAQPAGTGGRGGGAANAAGGQGRGGRGGPQTPRFQTLSVQQSDTSEAEASLDVTPDRANDPAARLLPPGFSLDSTGESLTVNGSMVEIDRGQLNDRLQALGRGEFGLAEGQFGPAAFGQAGPGGAFPGGDAGRGGTAGGPGGGQGGGGGRGGFGPGGLTGRVGGANRLQMSANYSLGSSVFDSAPYPLRDVQQPKREYTQQTASFTVGGALKIPHLYSGSRTTFNVTYTAGRNGNLFDQFATVPSDALRRGDFSASSVAIIDPMTGQPFPGNQIPANRISPAAQALLGLIPGPTLDGDTRNFRNTGTTYANTDQFSLRITHSLTAPPQGRGGRGGGRGGAGGFGGGGGAGGRNGGAAGGRAGAAAGNTTGASAAPAGANGANGTASTGATGSTGTTATGSTGTTATGSTGSTATGSTGSTATGSTGSTATGTTASASPQGSQPASGQPASGQPAGGGPGQNARAGGAGGRQGGGGGRQGGGRGNFQPPLQATINATINYRRNDGDRLNVYPVLGGTNRGANWSVPVTLNIRNGRSTHTFNVNFSQTNSSTFNAFAFNNDVGGDAGIRGIATDPFDWGAPTITFGSYTALRDITPSQRTDRSWQAGYTWVRTAGRHNFRIGGSYQQQLDRTRWDSNANGSFTFTGLYTAGGLQTTRGSGQDFADFLLGLPQQATRQYSLTQDNLSSPVAIRGRQVSAYLQDDWRWKPRWTINLGLQYDFVAPFTELNGHMVNLDVAPAFVAVAPVEAGADGPYSGAFPSGLVYADGNNIAPRVGAAWRATNRSAIRFGYGLTYNTGTYSNIARQLYQEPPFFQTGTSLGSLVSPITLADPFVSIVPSAITNSFGIDKNYQLGLIHQWSTDYSRDLLKSWNAGVTYFGTLGQDLDLLRAPNRGPTGLRIPNVQSFTWQSSQGASHANGVSFRLQKRQTKGISGSVAYTLSKARDNTTATGGGATVAQDDQNLAAEWGPSNFDQRHQLNGNMNVQLPWGLNRQWLNSGGWLAAIVGDWSMTANLTWNSGTPLTIRCSTCASDVARGTGGTLRANYVGLPIQLADPTIDEFFDTAAFVVPAPGTFGNSLRNMVVGPGSHLLNASFSRDVRLAANRGVTIQVNANNLLNTVNYTGIDTNVNSPTFGQVTSVRPMRTVRLNLRFRF